MKKQGFILILTGVAFMLAIGAWWLQWSPAPLQPSVSMTHGDAADGSGKEIGAILENRMDSIDKQVNNIQALYLDLSKKQNEVVEKVDKLSNLLQNLYENQPKASPTPLSSREEKGKELEDKKFSLSEKNLEIEQNQRKELARLEAEMAAQDVDMAWSSAAENQIRQNFAEKFPQGSNIVDVKCRTTLCQIQVIHDSEEDKENFIEEFPDSIPWDHEGFFSNTEENGAISSSVYITRDANR